MVDTVASIADRMIDLGAYLREQRLAAQLSVRQLAHLAGVSNPYLSQVERGLRKPSAEVLQQIAKGLRISAEALYVKAGILDSEGRPDVPAAIAADPGLTDRQRRALLDIYASFCAENHRAAPEEVGPGGTEEGVEPARAPAAPSSARTPTTKAAARRAATKRTAAKRSATTKSVAKRTATTKSATKRTGTKKSATKKSGTKKSGTKKSGTETVAKKATTPAAAGPTGPGDATTLN